MFYMSLLNISGEKLSLAEKLEQVLTTGVVGYILVFVVLALIWFLLALFGKIFEKKSSNKKAIKTTEVVIEPAPVAPAAAASDDAATVAAIVAAISEYTGKPASGFKVVSFRKKN